MAAAAGLTLGLAGGAAGVIVALAAALLFVGAAHLADKLQGRKEHIQTLPLAPFLSAGFLAAYFWKYSIRR